jgi:DNA polymerase III subunit gamma/tau
LPDQALYLKWRPTAFDEVVGQEHIIRTLKNSLKLGRIRHAYLFSGPRGTGKTTNARLLAKAVNCTYEDPEMRPCNQCHNCIAVNEGRFLDLIEIDAASHTGVDDVRDLREKIAFAPSEGKYKVYIIDEVHRFSGSAFDALLKTLEEPPDHAMFILATTEIDKVPATIKSRCLPFEFRRLTMSEVADRLQAIAEAEGIQIERAALELIAREGTGSARDSISLLDQVVADPNEKVTLELTQRILGTASTRAVREMIDALVEKNTARGIHIINDAIDKGSDPRQFAQQVVEQLRYVLLTQASSTELFQASAEEKTRFQALANRIQRAELLRAIRIFNEAVVNYRGGWQPQLALELAYLESLQEAPQPMIAPANTFASASTPSLAVAPSTPATELQLSGKPPVIAPQAVSAQWANAQRLIQQNIPNAKGDQAQHVSNLPSLMDHAHIRAVDGNIIIVGAPQFYYNKLNESTRISWIERAISRVTGVELRLKLIVDDGRPSDTQYMTPSPDADPDPIAEILMEAGGVLVKEEFIEEIDDNTQES